MKVDFVRPKVSDLVFQLFGRSLHPELFEVFGVRKVRREHYEATIQITDSSHVVSWHNGEVCLSEVAAPSSHPLPGKRRLLAHRLRGEHSESVALGHATYQVSFQLERMSPEVFWHVQDELAREGPRRGLFYQFRTSCRIAMGPISYIHIEARTRSLLVQAFHTFPNEHALVKTQSLFELGK